MTDPERIDVPCGVCDENLSVLREPVRDHEFVHGTCVGRPEIMILERLLPICPHTGRVISVCICMVHDPDGANFRAMRSGMRP